MISKVLVGCGVTEGVALKVKKNKPLSICTYLYTIGLCNYTQTKDCLTFTFHCASLIQVSIGRSQS